MKKYLSVYFLFFLSYFCQGQVTRPETKNYSSAYSITGIACDSQFVWIATWGGLVRFNQQSHQLVNYNCGNSQIINNTLSCMYEDQGGVIYMGQTYGGLVIFDGTTWTYIDSCTSGERIIGVYGILPGPNGSLYISFGYSSQGNSYTALAIFQNNQLVLWTNSPIAGVNGFATDKHGNLWAGTYLGLYYYNGAAWTTYDSLNAGFPCNGVTVIGTDTTGAVWIRIGCPYGGSIYKFDGITLTAFPDSITGNAIRCSRLFANPRTNHVYFFGSGCTGVTEFDGANWSYHDPQTGISSAHCPAFVMDNYDNLFFGTNSSGWLTKDSSGIISRFDLNSYPLRSNYGVSVKIGKGNKKYFSLTGAIYESDGLTVTPIDLSPYIGQYVEPVILSDQDNNIWILDDYIETGQVNGVVMFNGNSWTPIPLIAEYGAADSAGRMWFVGQSLYEYDHGVIQDVGATIPGFPDPPFFWVTVDTRGAIWMANFDNIIKYDGMTLAYFNSANAPLRDDNNFCVVADRSGNVWLNGSNSGISRFDGFTWHHYDTTNSSLPPTYIYQIVPDKSGNMWFAAYTGLIRYDGNDFTVYDSKNSGIGYEILRDLDVDDFNNIWVASIEDGITVFNSIKLNYSTVVSHGPYGIQGKIFNDLNQNGLKDSLDYGVWNQSVLLLPDSTFQFTNPNGDFRFDKNSGSYTLLYNVPQSWNLSTNSNPWSVQLDTTDLCCFDFGLNINGQIDSLTVDMAASTNRCLNNFQLSIELTNVGTTIKNSRIVIQPDHRIQVRNIFPAPLFTTPDSIGWEIDSLRPLTHFVCTIAAMNQGGMGDTLLSLVKVSDSASGIEMASDSLVQVIYCSYDPNEKCANPIGLDSSHYTPMNSPIEYTILFQNLGNDTAFNVCIRDTLSSLLDLSSFDVIGSNYSMSTSLSPNRVVQFTFSDINLPPEKTDSLGSQGFLKYRINSSPSISSGSRVENRATIYFDLNPGVLTNTTWNTFVNQLPLNNDNMNAKNLSILVYPNPFRRITYVQIPGSAVSPFYLNLLDLTGRLLQQSKAMESPALFEPSQINPGIYILEVRDAMNRIIDRIKVIEE